MKKSLRALRKNLRRAGSHAGSILYPIAARALFPFVRHHHLVEETAPAVPGPLNPRRPRIAPEPAPPVTGVRRRAIPRSGETLPVVGLGTWQTFDVEPESSARAELPELVRLLAGTAGGVLDSSPMYGQAEAVAGELVAGLGLRREIFLASKIWCHGRRKGARQLQESSLKLRAAPLDLMQVHNLEDVDTHVRTLSQWKEAGRVRYIGLSHYQASSYPLLEKLAKTGTWDFVQINYSMAEREAENRLLPACADAGVAVIANRPLLVGRLIAKVEDRPLPGWAAELGCGTWSQLFLKYVLGHPAVTCVIPATRSPAHMRENLEAGTGVLPDERLRRRMADYLGGI
jgi:diketogulonate reductase-like aldo/keto reductase